MTQIDQETIDAPFLVLEPERDNQAVCCLALAAMVEVPSGTSGPWIALQKGYSATVAATATAGLRQAMWADAVAGSLDTGAAGGVEPCSWRLMNTKVATADGTSLYLSPLTVCWCDDDGEPRYECDDQLCPAQALEEPTTRIGTGYRFVPDERLG